MFRTGCLKMFCPAHFYLASGNAATVAAAAAAAAVAAADAVIAPRFTAERTVHFYEARKGRQVARSPAKTEARRRQEADR